MSNDGIDTRTRTPASWRELVVTQVTEDEAELAATGRSSEHIDRLLRRATDAAAEPGGVRGWWRGSPQELAWLSLHEAEAEIDLRVSGPELEAHARDLLVKARRLLPASDPRVAAVESALGRPQGPPPHAVAHLARAVWHESDAQYARSRSFRNRLILLTFISVLALGLLILAFGMKALPLPVDGVSHIEVGLLVALFGALGALITAVPPLARAQGTWNPFSLPVYQMLLKLALGPIFAAIGVLALQAGVIPDVKPPMALADLLFWAVAFGATQQAVTRFVDARVAGLVSSDPKQRGTENVRSAGGAENS